VAMRLPIACLLAGFSACADSSSVLETANAERGTTHPLSAGANAKQRVTDAFTPRAYRHRGADAVHRNSECVRCHTREAEEWAQSRHKSAFTNSAFTAAFVIEPTLFCWGCHAPEAKSVDHQEETHLGVGCVTCHVPGSNDDVLAAPLSGAEERAPHPVSRSAAFASTDACASCHEFAFPGLPGNEDRELMQTTVREHARSASADRSCASCHMPERGGRRSHRFDLHRDESWLREQVDASATRLSADTVRITLTQRTEGHALPTGDLFRRVEVGAKVIDDAGVELHRETSYLARYLDTIPGERARTLTLDNRVFSEPREIELTFPADALRGNRVAWWVRLQRVAHAPNGIGSPSAKIESEVMMAEGTIEGEPIR
jgi:hypothetical protein